MNRATLDRATSRGSVGKHDPLNLGMFALLWFICGHLPRDIAVLHVRNALAALEVTHETHR